MNAVQLAILTEACRLDEPDVEAIVALVREQAKKGFVDPFLQDVAMAILAEGDILLAVHEFRSFFRGTSWANNQLSKAYVEKARRDENR